MGCPFINELRVSDIDPIWRGGFSITAMQTVVENPWQIVNMHYAPYQRFFRIQGAVDFRHFNPIFLIRRHRYFLLEPLDFCFEGFVFGQFTFEKTAGHGHFLCQTRRGKDVGVFQLVFAVAEVIELDEAFVDKRIEAIVKPTQAHTELGGDFPLAEVWRFMQRPHNAVEALFLDGALPWAGVF